MNRRRLSLLIAAPVTALATALTVLTTGTAAQAAGCAEYRYVLDHFHHYDVFRTGPADGLISWADFVAADNGHDIVARYIVGDRGFFNQIDAVRSAADGLISPTDISVRCGF